MTETLQSVWEAVSSDPKAVTDGVIAAFTVILAVATIQLARATNVLASDTRQNSRQREIQNAISASQSIISELTKASNMIEHITTGFAPEAYAPLNAADGLALACKAGLYDVRLLRSLAGITISRQYAYLKPSILRLREIAAEPDMFAGIDWLAANMPEARRR